MDFLKLCENWAPSTLVAWNILKRAYVFVCVCVTPIINRWCLIFCHHICFWLCRTVTKADEMIQREREWRRDVYIKVIIICIKSTCLCKLNFRYYVLHLCGRCCECTRSFECVCVSVWQFSNAISFFIKIVCEYEYFACANVCFMRCHGVFVVVG